MLELSSLLVLSLDMGAEDGGRLLERLCSFRSCIKEGIGVDVLLSSLNQLA